MARKYLQGRYVVRNPEKYLGDVNNVIYRSSWELKFFIYADQSPNIIGWNSEEVVIPYISPIDGKIHRYYTDAYIELKRGNKIEKKVCEIKPEAEKYPPKQPKKVTRSYINRLKTFHVNQAKWKSATEFCNERDMEFVVLTERELGIK